MTNLMYFSLFGGLMLLVYGIRQTGEGLQKAAGPLLKQALAYLTKNRASALVLGVIITLLTQSSTATTVMLVGFVNSGIMSFAQTLGVILGADIGTTITIQIIAFNILEYSVLLVGLGLLGTYIGKSRTTRDVAQAVTGFGFIFLSMKIMSDATAPLAQSDSFRLILLMLKDNPVIVIAASAVFTAMVASSAATIGVALSLATHGLIDLHQALPVILGANLGTCATALFVGFTGGADGKRVAYAHTLFKIIGVVIFFPLMGYWAGIVAHSSDSVVRQIANAHTFFNVFLALLFLPFTGLMAWAIGKFVKGEREEEPFGPKYLDESVLVTPPLALSQAAREAIRMADIVQDMLVNVPLAFELKDENFIPGIENMDDRVDKLDRGIRFYLAKIPVSLTEEQSRRELSIISITSDLENIGDTIDKNLMALARKKIKHGLSFSKEGHAEVMDFYRKIAENFQTAVAAFTANDLDLADRVMKNKERIEALEKDYRNAHIERLKQGLKESFETSAIHLDMLSHLHTINTHVTHMAYTLLEARGQSG